MLRLVDWDTACPTRPLHRRTQAADPPWSLRLHLLGGQLPLELHSQDVWLNFSRGVARRLLVPDEPSKSAFLTVFLGSLVFPHLSTETKTPPSAKPCLTVKLTGCHGQ